ncbi:peptidoglycan-binding domain-containing protein [Streptomyces sp. WMMC940]|uniref:peptidoglycan-binding domain-containing protein n=1 Tax=Streptomyces sp. WMMC940 TaxID=3015153 RepID=UPI0022B741BD|nr:peptidoglycan-binding domain-containing protein [Streptomyces sp. WMMC940]MCZ7460520.1 peptidoglycan-binding domain-containing protein [Streptomyces sp. WMMC940]
MTGHVCPECGRQDDADGRSGGVRGCDCGRAATTEGFDPLRVRPYVALPDPANAPAATVAGPPPELTQLLAPAVHGAAGQDGAPDAPHGAAGHGGAYDHRYEHGRAYDMTGAEPDLAAGGRRRGRGRGGRRVAVAVAAVVAVLGTAAYASGLLTKDDGGNDALPDSETTAPFVSAAPDAPDASVSASESAPRSASPSASGSSAASTPASASPRPGASSPAPLAAGPTSPSATPTGGTAPAPSSPAPGVTLQRGDEGPEVVELQERLEQVGLYGGRSHGRYDGRVEDAVAEYQDDNGIRDDPEGVYGPATRRALEAETRYPYDHDGGGNGGWDGDGRG